MHKRDAMFKLAFLTDPHLAPLPRPTLPELASKRILGYLNWRLFRNKIHNREVLDALVADMQAQAPDHIAIGGDVSNLSLRREFPVCLEWLRSVGPAADVSLVPGNHDAYVPVGWDNGLGVWRDYMRGDDGGTGFPWVRTRGEIALVGVNSAVPKPPGFASGAVGEAQLVALGKILTALGQEGRFRVVMVHHPPLVGMSDPRRGLDDAERLQETLRVAGTELVLFGHRHFHSVDELVCDAGPIPVVGAPSASSVKFLPGYLARYALFDISRNRNGWSCELTWRGLEALGGKMVEIERRSLTG